LVRCIYTEHFTRIPSSLSKIITSGSEHLRYGEYDVTIAPIYNTAKVEKK